MDGNSKLVIKYCDQFLLCMKSLSNYPHVYTPTCFLGKILQIYDKCCPLKVIKVNYKTQKPWFTKGIIRACKKKNLLYRKFLKSRTTDIYNIIRNSKKNIIQNY